MSPTTIFSQCLCGTAAWSSLAGWGGGVPGVVGLGGSVGGLYRYPGPPSQDPIFSIYLVLDPTHGQMRAILVSMMRFPRMGLEWV